MKDIIEEKFKDYWETIFGERPDWVYLDKGIDLKSIKISNKVKKLDSQTKQDEGGKA